MQCHPDKLSFDLSEEERVAAVDKFHTLTKAYEILSDSGKRVEYDSHSNCEHSKHLTIVTYSMR